MPILNILIPTGHSAPQKEALLKGVTQAVLDSLKAPLATIRVTLQEVSPSHTIVAGEIGHSMALVTAMLIAGRTPELKAGMIKAVSQAVQDTIGVSMNDTRIIIHDIPNTDMGVAGGITAKAAGR